MLVRGPARDQIATICVYALDLRSSQENHETNASQLGGPDWLSDAVLYCSQSTLRCEIRFSAARYQCMLWGSILAGWLQGVGRMVGCVGFFGGGFSGRKCDMSCL